MSCVFLHEDVTSKVRTGTMHYRPFPSSPHVAHVSYRSVYIELQHTLFALSVLPPYIS